MAAMGYKGSKPKKLNKLDKRYKVPEEPSTHKLRVLFLGAADSGKTTAIRQVERYVWTSFERLRFKKFVISNLIDGMTMLIDSELIGNPKIQDVGQVSKAMFLALI